MGVIEALLYLPLVAFVVALHLWWRPGPKSWQMPAELNDADRDWVWRHLELTGMKRPAPPAPKPSPVLERSQRVQDMSLYEYAQLRSLLEDQKRYNLRQTSRQHLVMKIMETPVANYFSDACQPCDSLSAEAVECYCDDEQHREVYGTGQRAVGLAG